MPRIRFVESDGLIVAWWSVFWLDVVRDRFRLCKYTILEIVGSDFRSDYSSRSSIPLWAYPETFVLQWL